MPRSKTVTPQTIIGEKGISLITQRCLEMGFLFHPRRVDHGIDGHIDLVDPATGALLNTTVLVQSKAQNRPFTAETDDGFSYICDERDLDLWLSGNAPVLLVLSHPDDRQAWWVEVKSAFPDAASRAKRTVRIDKRQDRFDESAAQALLRVGVPTGTGLYLRPPPRSEELTTNLLPVESVPPVIYLGEAAARDYRTAGAILAQARGRASGWILRDGLVLSFHDLRQRPLNALCSGAVEEHLTAEWANTTDRDIQHRFMDLLTRTVQDSYPELRWHKERRHVHFRATSNLAARKAGRGPGSRGRTVFGPHYKKSEPGQLSYYHHAALRMQFRRLDDRWYCQLEPDYCFTSDGQRESVFADSLLAGIKRMDRHPAVTGWTRMWANYLGEDKGLFTPEVAVGFGPLETVTVEAGIDDRWWGPAPTDVRADEEADGDQESNASVMARLTAADVDTDDLLTLFVEPEPQSTPRGSRGPSQRRRPRTGRKGSVDAR